MYRLPRPKDPRPHRPDRTAHGLGNFLVAQSFALPQSDRGAQVFRQRFDHLEYGLFYLVLEQKAFGGGVVTQFGCGLVLIGVLNIDIEIQRTTSLRDQEILGGIDGYPILPRIIGALSAKLVQGTIGLDKSVLRHVPDFGLILYL